MTCLHPTGEPQGVRQESGRRCLRVGHQTNRKKKVCKKLDSSSVADLRLLSPADDFLFIYVEEDGWGARMMKADESVC